MPTGNAPVKFFMAFITNDLDVREHALHNLSDKLGPTDYVSEWYDFTMTTYYSAEMGDNLKRSFASFEKVVAPEELVKMKLVASKVEALFVKNGKRSVNIDPGYVDYFKLVLASGKFGGHKVALAKGCYADFIMLYNKGKWDPLPWCFPDFASGIYNKSLTEMRRLFKQNRAVTTR